MHIITTILYTYIIFFDKIYIADNQKNIDYYYLRFTLSVILERKKIILVRCHFTGGFKSFLEIDEAILSQTFT